MTKIADLSGSSPNGISGRDYLKRFAKQMLRNSLFVGVFHEKRFVESLGSYRDVISICPGETEFIENVLAVLKKIDEELVKKPWVGVTGPDAVGAPVGYCLWVALPKEVFGKYWYKVKTVEFFDAEIRLKLEILRPFQSEATPRTSPPRDGKDSNDFDVRENLQEISHQLKDNLIYFCKNTITLENIKHSVIFLALLIGTIVAGTVNISKYLLEYSLKLMNETSNLIKAMTPLLINFTNLVGKLIFGFYHTTIALFRGKSQVPAPVYNSYFTFDPQQMQLQDPRQRYNKYFSRGLPYPSQGGGPTITPLD
ncbi:hypothetical protein JTB14_025865 [Gonioctena quinquepunctata]|nr:hypothetical protein JTB14_025865 [Gonioctena quinquepunctata]